MYAFSDSDEDDENDKRPASDVLAQLELLEQLHDEMERDQDSGREIMQSYLEAEETSVLDTSVDSGNSPLLGCTYDVSFDETSPAMMLKTDAIQEETAAEEVLSPLNAMPAGDTSELKQQIRHLTMQLASERRIRRESEMKLARQVQRTSELEESLLMEQEEKQELVEQRQRADDDYVATQAALAQANDGKEQLQKKIRSIKDDARLEVDKCRGYRLDGMSLKELESLEHQQEEVLTRVRSAKEKCQRVELERVQRELEELHESRLCVICRENEIQVIITPCSHACLCQECAQALCHRSDPCPMCRGPIDSVATIYVS